MSVVAYHCHGETQVAEVFVGGTPSDGGEIAHSELFRTLAKWLRHNPEFHVVAVNMGWDEEEGPWVTAWGTGPVAVARVTR